jgi:hypothetical protein
MMDRNGEDWTGDDISEKASVPSGAHEDTSGEAPGDSDGGSATPPDADEPEDFRPEGAEFEPAGGIISKPPTPERPDDPPTEGDRR